MEVPLPADAFGLGRRLGVGWDLHHEKIGAHLTAFGSDLNEDIGKFGYGVRLYTNPTRTRFRMFHLGISAIREEMDRDARFRAYPETRVTDIRLVDTGQFPDVDQQSIYGLELAAARDSYSFRSEYFVADWDRLDEKDARFKGYYLQANWAITGESFQYAQGKFLRIRPQHNHGAFEIALRYSSLDLNDGQVLGGKQENLSFALNWYSPGNQFRIQSSVIYLETDEVAGDQSTTIYQLRAQLHW
jgi:phosphate-selective porin OprO/OprP